MSHQSHNGLVQRRIFHITALALALLVIIAGRLVWVQAVDAASYKKKANLELEQTSTLLAPRGEITDINGVELARSVAAVTIVVDQTMITDPAKAAGLVAPILNLPVATLTPMLTGTLRYRIIAKDVTPEVWINVQNVLSQYNTEVMKEKNGIALRVVGFFSERSYIREYPTGRLASSLIGFINDAGVGASGIEYAKESILKGINGQYQYSNGAGTIIPGSATVTTEAKAGTGIELTIDRDIQWVAQDAITKAVAKDGASSGTIIVMDPKTGAILALATSPTFDPNNKKTISLKSIRNPSVQDVYEPGSTGKVITAAAAIQEGKVTPTTVFTVPYALKRSNFTFHDHEKHGTQRLTTAGVLAISSNTGAIQIGETLDHQTQYNYLKKFGIGDLTGSGIAGESSGVLPPLATWSGTTGPTVSFGQGYSVTALQATSVFATIANDGLRVTPTVIAGTTDSNGNFSATKTQKSEQVISPETARQVRLMLESVVSENGTAPGAAIPGYRVAGKTGTAQRYNDKCGCYSGYTASFIGFAPADAPKYVVSVTIQDPKGLHWGGTLGGPLFKTVMSFVLQSKHVPPTPPLTSVVPLTEAQIRTPVDSTTVRRVK
jgi:cell division protein FtsI (penicillin-binding protein 3)